MTWPFGNLPMFGFDLIMVDPPWRFDNWSWKGEHKNAAAKYDCMTEADIAALPIGHLAAPDCLLWLWATNPMLDVAIRCVSAWGFQFKTAGTWVKRTSTGKLAFGTGYLLRSANEPFLIGTVGSPRVVRNVRTVIEGRVREHSRKPDEAYQEAERLIANARRADLFSREARPGWECWGNECGRFNQEGSKGKC